MKRSWIIVGLVVFIIIVSFICYKLLRPKTLTGQALIDYNQSQISGSPNKDVMDSLVGKTSEETAIYLNQIKGKG